MKNMKLIALLICLSVIVCSLVGCAKTAPVKFELNGGTLPADTPELIEYTTSAELALPVPTKQYYKFEGWSLSSDGSSVLKDNKIPAEMELTDEQVENGVKLYAVWTRLTGKIEYSLEGGAWEGNAGVASYDYGSRVTLPKNVEREYFEFEGWTLDGEEIEEITADKTGDVNLVATWKQVYTPITFVLRNENASLPDADDTFETEYGLELNSEFYQPTAPGAIFAGWYLSEADCNDPDAVPVIEIEDNTTEPVTLYAKWIEAPTIEDENNQNWVPTNK